MQIESQQWAFQRAINRGHVSPLTFPKWVQIPKVIALGKMFHKKALKVCYKVSLSKNSQRQIVAQ